MKLSIKQGVLFAANLHFSLAEVPNGRDALQPGCYPVTVSFSHTHGEELARADGLGWIGATPQCDIVLARVRGGNGSLPCAASVGRLLSVLERCEASGETVSLVVE